MRTAMFKILCLLALVGFVGCTSGYRKEGKADDLSTSFSGGVKTSTPSSTGGQTLVKDDPISCSTMPSGWKHDLPDIAQVKVSTNFIEVRFQWYPDAQNHPNGKVGFVKGQAWELSLMTWSPKTSAPVDDPAQSQYTQRNTTHDPFEPYPHGTDYWPWNTNDATIFDFSKEENGNYIPVLGGYRDVYNYANKTTVDGFISQFS